MQENDSCKESFKCVKKNEETNNENLNFACRQKEREREREKQRKVMLIFECKSAPQEICNCQLFSLKPYVSDGTDVILSSKYCVLSCLPQICT